MYDDSIKSAYLDMLVEKVDILEDEFDLEYSQIDEAATGDRPSDQKINSVLEKHKNTSHLTYSFNDKPADYPAFSKSLEKSHKIAVNKVKSDIQTEFGGKTTVTKHHTGTRLISRIHSNGHPVAELHHVPEAQSPSDYPKWDKVNKFKKFVSTIPAAHIQLHKEHLEKLKAAGSKEKAKFDNSSIYVTHLGKPETQFTGHGSQGSINVKTKSLVSKISAGKTEHKIQDTWDKYD